MNVSSNDNPIRTPGGRGLTFLFGLFHKGFWGTVQRLSWNRSQMESFQLEQLKKTISFAYENSVFYKNLYEKAGVKPSDLKSLADIRKFPVVTKALLKQALADKSIFTQSIQPKGTVAEPTTGSTGNPVTLYLDKHAHHGRVLNGTRALWMMGAFPYKRFAFLWRKKKLSFGQRLREKLGLFKFIPVVDVQNATGSAVGKQELATIVNELIEFQPQIIRGYTSALWIIAQHVKKYGLVLHPECIITSAESLPRAWQEEMENIFNCPVHNLYGGSEAAPVALSLSRDRELTVFSDFYFTEIANDDGSRTLPENLGRILVTDYSSLYMPLIRYEIGDVAEWSSEKTGAFPKFKEVKGRINDVFVLPGGKIIFSHNWHIYLRNLKSVSKFKVIQKALDKISITLERANPTVEWNEELSSLKKTVEDAFGPEIIFTWELVDSIPLDPGEKFRPVRSELDSSMILKSVSNSYVEKLKEYPLSSHKAWEFENKSEVMKLDWNEADMNLPESIKKPLREFIENGPLTWYPDVSNRELVKEIASYTCVPVECVQYFEGSDCGLDYVVRTFMQAGDEAILASPTYDNFRVYVESVGGIPKSVFGKNLFKSDVAAITEVVTSRTKIIYIVNPNNPTGAVYSQPEIEEILKKFLDVMVIIDEAYMEFSGTTVSNLVSKYPNLIVTRSFAKAFGLASFRIGYVLSASENIGHINKIRNGKNVPALAQIAALAALRNKSYMEDYVSDVRSARSFLTTSLQDLGFETTETTGNFILVKIPDALTFRNALLEKKVFVRALDHLPGMEGYVRITVPGMSGTEKFITIVKDLKTAKLI